VLTSTSVLCENSSKTMPEKDDATTYGSSWENSGSAKGHCSMGRYPLRLTWILVLQSMLGISGVTANSYYPYPDNFPWNQAGTLGSRTIVEIILLWITIPFLVFGWNPFDWCRNRQVGSLLEFDEFCTQAQIFCLENRIARCKRYLRVYRWVSILFFAEGLIFCTSDEALISVHAVVYAIGLSWDLERRLCTQDFTQPAQPLSSYPEYFVLMAASRQYNITVRKYCYALAIANSGAAAIWYQILREERGAYANFIGYTPIYSRLERHAANMIPILALTLSPFVLAILTINIPRQKNRDLYDFLQSGIWRAAGATAVEHFSPNLEASICRIEEDALKRLYPSSWSYPLGKLCPPQTVKDPADDREIDQVLNTNACTASSQTCTTDLQSPSSNFAIFTHQRASIYLVIVSLLLGGGIGPVAYLAATRTTSNSSGTINTSSTHNYAILPKIIETKYIPFKVRFAPPKLGHLGLAGHAGSLQSQWALFLTQNMNTDTVYWILASLTTLTGFRLGIKHNSLMRELRDKRVPVLMEFCYLLKKSTIALEDLCMLFISVITVSQAAVHHSTVDQAMKVVVVFSLWTIGFLWLTVEPSFWAKHAFGRRWIKRLFILALPLCSTPLFLVPQSQKAHLSPAQRTSIAATISSLNSRVVPVERGESKFNISECIFLESKDLCGDDCIEHVQRDMQCYWSDRPKGIWFRNPHKWG